MRSVGDDAVTLPSTSHRMPYGCVHVSGDVEFFVYSTMQICSETYSFVHESDVPQTFDIVYKSLLYTCLFGVENTFASMYRGPKIREVEIFFLLFIFPVYQSPCNFCFRFTGSDESGISRSEMIK